MHRFKAGRKLATEGPDRTRLRDKQTVTALCELAALSFTALAAYDQRRQHGIPLNLAVPESS